MAGQLRMVNVIPHTKIKKEVISDDDEDCVECSICNKSFASEGALNNHARIEHTDTFLTGDPTQWTLQKSGSVPKGKTAAQTAEQKLVQVKTEQMISSMEPTSLVSLAYQDVSYILIKPSKDAPAVRKVNKRVIHARQKQQEAVAALTGPFLCQHGWSPDSPDEQCNQVFDSCCAYSLHFAEEHTKRRKLVRCQVCENLLTGEKNASGKRYPCEVCGDGFQTNMELSDHVSEKHVQLKPFQCNICEKRFTQQGGLHQHMRMHTGSRPYACSYCPKAFTQKSGLDQHTRVHTNEKPYRCVICHKAFCQPTQLKQHIRTHTNLAPFQCYFCDKRFKQNSQMKSHIRSHNPETMSAKDRLVYERFTCPRVRQVGGGERRVRGEERRVRGEERAARGEKRAARGEERAARGEERAAMGEERAAKGEERAVRGEEMAARGEEMAARGEEMAARGEERVARKTKRREERLQKVQMSTPLKVRKYGYIMEGGRMKMVELQTDEGQGEDGEVTYEEVPIDDQMLEEQNIAAQSIQEHLEMEASVEGGPVVEEYQGEEQEYEELDDSEEEQAEEVQEVEEAEMIEDQSDEDQIEQGEETYVLGDDGAWRVAVLHNES